MTPHIVFYAEHHINAMVSRFEGGAVKFTRYLQDQQNGSRDVLVCVSDDVVRGYVTIVWQSSYPPFRKAYTPELVDLYVHTDDRGLGLGALLLKHAEEVVKKRGFAAVGIGVGVSADYGPAQRLYASRGYTLDGTGLWHRGEKCYEGDTITIEPRTNLMMIKKIER